MAWSRRYTGFLVCVLSVAHLCLASGNPYEDEEIRQRVKRQLGGGGGSACMQIYTVPKREVMCEPSPEVRDSLDDMSEQLSGYQSQLDTLGERINVLDPEKKKELPEEVKQRLNTIDDVQTKQTANAEKITQAEERLTDLLSRIENVESTERIEMGRLIEQQSILISAALEQSNASIHNTYLDKLAESTSGLAQRIADVEAGLLERMRESEDGMEEKVHFSGNTSKAILDLVKERFLVSLGILEEKVTEETETRSEQYKELLQNTETLQLMESQLTVMREHQARYEGHESNLRQEIQNLRDQLVTERGQRDILDQTTKNMSDRVDDLALDLSALKRELGECRNQSKTNKGELHRLEEHVKRKEHILPKTIKVRDCQDALKFYHPSSGVYTIDPTLSNQPVEVFCDMEEEDVGWTVIQSRQDGHVEFFKGWSDYKKGFGDPDNEFWLGLQTIFELTSRKEYQLKVELQDWEDHWHQAMYDIFSIADEDDHYRLSVGGYHGDAGDSLSYHNDMPFSTMDRNNDHNNGICATWCRGAWWYKDCFHSNLNGHYYNQGPYVTKTGWGDGVVWRHIQGTNFYSLKAARMKIRPLAAGSTS